jgi:hypothetical protein
MNPSFVRGLLLGGDIAGAVAVALGIVFEKAAANTKRHRWSCGIVIAGVVVESIFGIALFCFDESISQSQQDKIIALEGRLAARSLSSADQHDVAAAVNGFAGQQFRIGLYPEDQESIDIARNIASGLVSAGWAEIQPSGNSAIVGVTAGVVVNVAAAAPESTRSAAKALVNALNAKTIATTLRQIQNPDASPRLIVVDVGIKP